VQECAEFLENVAGLKISKSDISALERRTEGWAAGLQLAALSMQGRDDLQRFVQEFTGSNRYVLDYLAQEVFEKQTGEVQNFLLKTSILERLCASLCDAVTEHVGSQELIEALEQANLFIMPLDQSRNWYRYHRLFRDLLHNRLHAQGELALKALHQCASSWYEDHGLLSDAIQHTLACGDWERTLKLFHSTSGTMIHQGEIFTLLNWYSQIPDPMIRGDAETCLEYSWILLLSGQFDHARVYISLAEGFAIDNPSFVGQLLNAQAYLARAQGDLRRMVTLSHQALSILPKEDLGARCVVSINLGIAYWHSGKMDAAESALAEVLETGRAIGNLYAISMAAVFQGMILAVRGKLREAHDRFLIIVQQEDTSAFLREVVYLYLSYLEYEWNHLEQSGKYLLEAFKIGERIQNDELFISNWMMMARLHTASGNLPAAGDALEKAQQKVIGGEFSVPAMPRLAAARVQQAIARSDLASAAYWAEHLAEGGEWHPFYQLTDTTRALYLLANHKPGEASSHLEHCFARAAQEGWVYGMIVIRALQALAAAQQEAAPEAAVEYLKDALRWAQPEGYVRTFVDLGKGMETLLRGAVQRRIMPEYAENILSAASPANQKSIIGQLTLVEPIHPRELEVLRLMAAGQSNSQIAEQLVVSIGTVKTHVHNICGKLGTRNRIEATARARELGLV
jgi:LuxR family maltose regulon positive regulatory protein